MLLFLANWLAADVRAFSVLNYITLRAVFATMTALLISFVVGPAMIRKLTAALFAFGLMGAAPAPDWRPLDPENLLVIDTTKGRIIVEMAPDMAPQSVARVKLLAREGVYDGLQFHRVIEGFMAQTGDGQNFNGTGGSKYPNLKQEFSQVPFKRGVVGMARRGDSVDSRPSSGIARPCRSARSWRTPPSQAASV